MKIIIFHFYPQSTEGELREAMHKMSATIYGIGVGDSASDTRMARITHHFANFTYWRDTMQSAQHNVACE